MPLYEYELCEGRCETCGGRFAVPQAIGAAALAVCPSCLLPVRKIISLPNVPRITQPVSHIDAKKAGFTIYKRIAKGEYEKQ